MAQNLKILLIGCGNMGYAMMQGWVSGGNAKPSDIHVVEPVDALRDRAAGRGARTYVSANELPDDLAPDAMIVAVKPQIMDDVLPAYQGLVSRTKPVVISVAAGIHIARFQGAFGETCAIVRVMPNTPAAIGKGMMVVCPGDFVTLGQLEMVETLMAASGEVARVESEDQMDAVTAVSGSGPAYVFHMIEALSQAAKAAGLPDNVAQLLAAQTVYGSAVYAKESAIDPAELRRQVTSPNGTTQAGLEVLMDENAGLTQLLTKTVDAAKKRSIELG